jgi:putative peptidoglycan lipid II flippase
MVPNETGFDNYSAGVGRPVMTTNTRASARPLPPTAPPATRRQTPPAAAASGGAVRSFGRSATIVGAAFIVSRLLGLLREVILARQFGTSGEYDAYVSAFRVPDLLFLVVMSGAFGAAFIPVFGGFIARGDREGASELASAVISFTALITVGLGAITFIFAGPIMEYIVAPGLSPDLHEVATKTMRILLLSPILLGFGIAAKGILEAQDQFTLPAISPVLYNLAIIIFALALGPSQGVYGVAIGVVVGAALHFLVQVPGLIKTGLHFAPTLSRQVEGLHEVGRLLLPRIVGLAAFQINFIVINYLASQDGEGKVSALNYAWQLMMLPHGVLALSISTVIFPTMARLYQRGDMPAVRATFMRALQPLIFLILPASIGLFVFRVPIVQTIFQSGEFSGLSTSLVADPLALLAIGLAWYGLVEVLTRVFYAMHDTLTPVITGVAIIVINIVMGKILVDHVGYVGLALSLSVSTAIEAMALAVVLRRRLGRFPPSFGSWLGRVAVAAAIMALLAEALSSRLTEATVPGAAPRLVQLFLLGFALGIVSLAYFVAGYYLKLRQVLNGIDLLSRRVPGAARVFEAIGL